MILSNNSIRKANPIHSIIGMSLEVVVSHALDKTHYITPHILRRMFYFCQQIAEINLGVNKTPNVESAILIDARNSILPPYMRIGCSYSPSEASS